MAQKRYGKQLIAEILGDSEVGQRLINETWVEINKIRATKGLPNWCRQHLRPIIECCEKEEEDAASAGA